MSPRQANLIEFTGDPEGEQKLSAISPQSARINCISSSNLETASEEHLLAAAREGDQAAYGEMCKRHSKRILRITLRITRNYEDAEDALQECFLKAMIHIRDFDGRSQFSTWLTRIAINAALMKIRQKRKHRESSILTTAEFREERQLIELPDHSLSPEDIYSEREKAMILREALFALRPRIRAARRRSSRILGPRLSASQGRRRIKRRILVWPGRQAGEPRIARHRVAEYREGVVEVGLYQKKELWELMRAAKRSRIRGAVLGVLRESSAAFAVKDVHLFGNQTLLIAGTLLSMGHLSLRHPEGPRFYQRAEGSRCIEHRLAYRLSAPHLI